MFIKKLSDSNILDATKKDIKENGTINNQTLTYHPYFQFPFKRILITNYNI